MTHPLDKCEGFNWDEGNSDKNWDSHHVAIIECEDVFFNPRIVINDIKHSHSEIRYHVLGISNSNRSLFLTVTIRNNSIRVISARDMNRKEKQFYEKEIKNHPKI